MEKNNSYKDAKDIIKNRATRVKTAKKSHLWFFHTYFWDYVQCPIADFHKEIFAITEDDSIKLAAICSFRGSGKSTLMTLSYPIWAILGRPQKKFVVIISQTAEQAKLHFRNLKRELETNDLLKLDLGPFQEQDEWNACSLVIPRYNAKIIAVSKDQRFRGVKHGRYRPDLIIADDVENSDSVKSMESRDSTYNWFTSEVLPLGDRNTKKIIIGNLLHQDSLLKRLESDIQEKRRSGIFRQYPIMDEDTNEISWPGKYPNMHAIEEEKMNVGNIFAWYREYLLRIIDNSNPIIDVNQLHFYDKLPPILNGQKYCFATGVDLAISEKENADYTAMVTAKVVGYGKNMRIYILPNPVNERLKFSEMINRAEIICKLHEGRSSNRFYIEEVMLQGFMTQQLKEKYIDAIGIPIHRKDKRTRLELAANPIFEGKVLFPRYGCDDLIDQMTNFNVAKHDDLVDAMTILILGIIDKPPIKPPQVVVLKFGGYGKSPHSGLSSGCSSVQFGSDGIPYRR